MRPQLFELLDVSFPAYFVLLLTGFSFATAVAVIWARRIGQNPDVIVDLSLACLLMGVVGSRIAHVLFDGFFWDYVNLCIDPPRVDWHITHEECVSKRYDGIWDAAKSVCHPSEGDCFAWAKFWAGGLTYYGGLIFASVTGLWLLRRDRFPMWKGADLSSVGIAIGLGFGRMGCLLAGCCFGKLYDGPLALTFPRGSPASEAHFDLGLLIDPVTGQTTKALPSLPVHPAQIYESAASFAIALICMFIVQPRKRYDGQIFVAFLILYAVARFALEFLRDDKRGSALGLSTSQLIGLLVVGAALVFHFWRVKQVKERRQRAA